MRLKILNFQSIGKAELLFPMGITALVGSSNSGKTAVVRALTSLLTNPSEAKSFIKYGESKTEVELEIDNQPNIKWTRTLKDSTYEIGDELHQKVGKTDAFELIPNTGFCKDEEGNILNIQDEWATLFPFDRNSSQMYKLFEEVFAFNNSSEVLHKIKTDEGDIKKALLELNKDYIKNETKINKITSFLNDNPVESLIKDKNSIQKIFDRLELLNSDSETVTHDLKMLAKIRDIKSIEVDNKFLDSYVKLISYTEYIESNIKLIDCRVDSLENDLSLLDNYIELKKDTEYILSNMPLLTLRIEEVEFEHKQLEDHLVLSKDVTGVLSDIEEYKRLTQELKETTEQLSVLNKEWSEIETCPVCGKEM